MERLTLDEHDKRGQEAMRAGNYEGAAAHFRAAAADTFDLALRDRFQEALKLRHRWLRMAKVLGFCRIPDAAPGLARMRVVYGTVFCGTLALLAKIGRASVAAQIGASWTLVGLFGVVLLGRIADCAATLWLRRGPGGTVAVTAGDAVGAGVHVAVLVLASAAAIAFATAQSPFWGAAALALLAAARALHLICRTLAPAGRFWLALYVTLSSAVCGVGLAMLTRQTTPGDLHQKIPVGAALTWALGVGLLYCTRFVQVLATELAGSGVAVVDERTAASRPGRVRLSHGQLRELHPELYGLRSLLFRLTNPGAGVSAKDARRLFERVLQEGDAQPAVVVKTQPLVVAVYSDDLDAVVLLEFPQALVGEHGLARGKRLVSVNTYVPMHYRQTGSDVEFGPRSTNVWGNVFPYIADFLTDDRETLLVMQARIEAGEWARLEELLAERLRSGVPARDGLPLYCGFSRVGAG